MANTLDSLRKKIDKLDDQIHNLIMQRAELIQDITKAKQAQNRPIVHPAREAMMIRRLLGNHKGILPQATIINIWRELVGAVSMMQRGLTGFVSAHPDHAQCWDMAKQYCGNVIPMTKCSEPMSALAGMRDTPDSIAILPWPTDLETNPWWATLIDQDHDAPNIMPIKIVAALPFGHEQEFHTLNHRAVIVGRMEFNPSGDDHSFIGITTSSPLSRAKIIDLLQEQNLEAKFITSQQSNHGTSQHYIAEVASYVTQDDDEIKNINIRLSEEQGKAYALGGYPVPPILRKNDCKPPQSTDDIA